MSLFPPLPVASSVATWDAVPLLNRLGSWVKIERLLARLDPDDARALDISSGAAYGDLGVSRVMGLIQSSADGDEAYEALVEDARAAGVELDAGA